VIGTGIKCFLVSKTSIMNIVISKIDPNLCLDQTDYVSLNGWEAAQHSGNDTFSIGVVHVNSISEYEFLLSDLQVDLESLPFNFLLLHSDGKILAYKYQNDYINYSYGKKFFESASSYEIGYQHSIKKFLADRLSIYQSKVFLSHASEDKKEVVLPLAKALNSANIDYWLDSFAIKLGDSITAKVNDGLRTAEYFVLVLSKSFVGKAWPEKELNSILNLNIMSSQDRIIPVLVGTPEEREKIRENYPLLHDIYSFSWNQNPDDFIRLFTDRVKRDL